MKNAYNWFNTNKLGLLFALLVGTLSVLPHLLALQALGSDYRGIPFMPLNNEEYYLSRIHEIADGHYLVGSPYFFEYKSIQQIVPPVGEYFYILLSTFTGASLTNTLILAKLFFPALLFLLVYFLLIELTKKTGSNAERQWGAVAGGLMVTIGVEITDYHLLFSRFLDGTHSEMVSMWTRPVNPITGALFLFAFLGLLWQSIERTSRKYAILAGIVLGSSLGYIFSFGIDCAVLGIFLVFFLLTKEYVRLKNLCITLAAGLSIPVLYSLQILPQMAKETGLAERNGLMLTHMLLPNKILLATIVTLGVLLFFAYHTGKINIRSEREKYLPLWFMILVVLGSFCALNQQVITGMTVWPYHFVQYTIPLAIVSLFVALFFLLRPLAYRAWKMIIITTITLTILFSIWNATSYTNGMDNFRKNQNFAPIFSWLNTNAPKDCVLLIVEDEAEQLTRIIPAFTHCNVYLTGSYLMGSIPLERVHHNFFVRLRLVGVGSNDVEQYLNQHINELTEYYYKDWFELFNLTPNDRILSLIPGIVNSYREFLKKDFETELKKYRIDYLVTQGDINPNVKKSLPRLQEVRRIGATTIYSLR